ncbi:MAP kinase phosphatase [Raphidocelis subcapitata]|uniref:protein-tyrosine-phosphatase n=1 Tax=Raphidocelis subcapitata TaxID=307507 RepID=A0A2V0NV29_9CHLO|nr:MAP kinase phosphatase [Raphidocelis subcapitata]|eukprot:GBF91494.1 MAP kinase phosphatase [Raphidocelis subcapitata]
MPLDARTIDADGVFRAVYAACPNDPKVLLVDVRPLGHFKKGHAVRAYCVRLSADGGALLDYSQASYDTAWSKDVWWGRPVIVYGPPALSRDHPVAAFLSREGRAASLAVYRDGLEGLAAAYPFLVTASVKQGCFKHYPSMILPRWLFLGDWGDAEAAERLAELGVKRIVSIHNHPENLKPRAGVRHLKLELPDVETADISAHFNAAYEFIDEGRRLKQPTLVHCGAGVSRSAALVAAYLMRSRPGTTAAAALAEVRAARSMVQPNDGFYRTLCALEHGLGIPEHERSDPNALTGFAGADAGEVKLSADAAGAKVAVVQLDAAGRALGAGAPAAPAAAPAAGVVGRGDEAQRRRRSRSRSRSREGERGWRDRARDRERERERDRRRSRSREREGRDGGRRDRSGSRERRRGRSRSRSRERDGHGGGGGRARDAPAPPPTAPADPVAAAAAAAAAAGKKGFLLAIRISKPDGQVGQLVLGPVGLHQRVVFGRAPPPAADVALEHASASRQHAALTVDAAGAVSLTDLGSSHGSKVGDAWIKPHAPKEVPLGAVMRFGASTRAYKLERVERVG